MRILTLLFTLSLFAGIEDQYRKLDLKFGFSGPENIDYIYVINLDKRPERWQKTLKELAPYGIIPERFPGIYGWALLPEQLDQVGLRYQPGMWPGKEFVMYFPPNKNGEWDFIYLNEFDWGKAVFSGWTVKGTIGCSLSHFSVLKDGYDSGYQTIWVMEDDVRVLRDPKVLSSLIEELYQVDPEWDLLYTDRDYLDVDPNHPIAEQIPWMWRPDMPFYDLKNLSFHEDAGDSFIRIGSRMRAHSILYSRSGMKKILAFYRENGNFLPYDNEVALIPEIRMYVVKDSVVTVFEEASDTRYRNFQ
ncbi:MAG: glycosyltransferase family 25 protein [Parachlamydiales bacterium]|nr:glycosyltransferase family 25 protein [Parachlamydiales bacterium]